METRKYTSKFDLVAFGKRVAAIRESLNMTQEEVAKKMGYTGRGAINNIEKAHSGVNISNIVPLARALNTTPNVLLGYNDVALHEQTKINPKLIEKLDMLSSVELNQVETLVDNLLKDKMERLVGK